MTETGQMARPKGLFDRSTKGHALASVAIRVEREQIRFFATVLGEADPIHFDVGAARAAGHADLVAPPSFFMPIEAMAEAERARLGHPSLLKLIGCDFRFLLHGDEHYAYHGAIHAGDELRFDSRVVDFYEKKGGLMELVTIASEITHDTRGLLVRGTRTLLHRLGQAQDHKS